MNNDIIKLLRKIEDDLDLIGDKIEDADLQNDIRDLQNKLLELIKEHEFSENYENIN
jgi:hypothetical protein